MQWALMTGMPDIDDVILNATGALAGRLLAGLFNRVVAYKNAGI
jgi:glycopeptide antibiotics resistance protein